MLMLHVDHLQFHLIGETSEVPTEVEVLLTSAVFYSSKHNETGLALAAATCLCSCCPVTLQPRSLSVVLLCLVPTMSSANLFPAPIDLSFFSRLSPLRGQALAWKSSSCSM